MLLYLLWTLCFCFINCESWSLTGISKSGKVKASVGEEYSLFCKTDHNTYDRISWRRNGRNIARLTPKGCIIKIYESETYLHSCVSGDTFRLFIPHMTDAEHDTVWQCLNIFGYSSNKFVLNVTVPVKSVTMFPENIIEEDVEEQLVVTCTTTACRPPAGIIWYRDNVKISKKIPNQIQQVGNKYITKSILSTKANPEDNGATFSCAANNTLNELSALKESISVSVYYPPEQLPYIKGRDKDDNVVILYENETVTLSCVSVGGNPVANLSWNCLDVQGKYSIQGAKAVSDISFIAYKWVNGTFCSCGASHRVKQYEHDVGVTIYVNRNLRQIPQPMKQTWKMIIISIPTGVLVVALTIATILLVRKYAYKASNSNRYDFGQENIEADGNSETIKSSTSNDSHLEAYIYESSDETIREYQNAGRVRELEAESSYEDLAPEDLVQVLKEWPYEDVPEMQQAATELAMCIRPPSNDYENQPSQPENIAVCYSDSSESKSKSSSEHSYEND